MRPPDVALAHYSDRAKLVDAAAEVAGQMWAEVDPNHIVESWTAQVPELAAVVTGAQLGAARPADRYLDDVASLDDLPSEAAASVDPGGFAGTASDGRSLLELLMSPGFTALQIIGAGLLQPGQAVAAAGGHLDTIVRTQVADAGRLADQTALVAHKEYGGYVRIVVGATCSRCLLLAGRWYAYNAAFQRHPRCDCTQLPANIAKAANFVQNPQAIYDRMTQTQRTKAGWTLGDQRAVGEGADLFAVTNAHRGVYTAGGRKFTREGTTRRGTFGGYKVDPETGKLVRRPRGEKPGPRLTPDHIFAEAATRDDAVRMLADNGYLRELPAQLRRPTIQLPAAGPAVDPALKMTVAQIKKAAKDAGVSIAGQTKKADMLAHLRSWEVGNARRIPGLPEWKPPTIRPTLTPSIPVPKLGAPSPGTVITGTGSAGWADLIPKTTPANGVRVQMLELNPNLAASGRYTVRTGTAWRDPNGVAYLVEHGPGEFGDPAVARALAEMRAAHDAIPAAARANKSYAYIREENPADPHWRKTFNNPGHVSAATAGDGQITLWNRKSWSDVDTETLRHETGHNLDDLLGRSTQGSASPSWLAAVDADAVASAKIADLTPTQLAAHKLATVETGKNFPKGVTQYGRSSAAEDYAESVMLYQLGPIATGRIGGEVRALYFRDIYPARAKLLDKVFPDIAKAQKAEIKALRSAESPANVAKREAAKVRQAAIDTATTKAQALADLDELVGKGASTKLIADNLAVLAQIKALAAVDLSALRRVVATGDRTKIAATVDRITGKYKLTGVAKAGDITTMREGFDVVGGKTLAPGTEVRIVRRGTEVVHNGETIVLSRPQVRAVTKAELAAIRDKAIADARAVVEGAREPGITKTGWALNRDAVELRAGPAHGRPGYGDAVDRIWLAPTREEARKMLEDSGVERIFRIGDFADIEDVSARLLRATEKQELIENVLTIIRGPVAATKPLTAVQLKKAGLTKVGTVSKTKTVAFDAKVYEVKGGGAVAAGAKVRVVEPGYSMTYRGETIVVRKPVIEAVEAKPVKAAARRARAST